VSSAEPHNVTVSLVENQGLYPTVEVSVPIPEGLTEAEEDLFATGVWKSALATAAALGQPYEDPIIKGWDRT
jgi:hypothetical protein